MHLKSTMKHHLTSIKMDLIDQKNWNRVLKIYLYIHVHSNNLKVEEGLGSGVAQVSKVEVLRSVQSSITQKGGSNPSVH
jgi:hypothetical protein